MDIFHYEVLIFVPVASTMRKEFPNNIRWVYNVNQLIKCAAGVHI